MRSSTCWPQPRYADWLGYGGQIEAASWPSGHGTAAMTLALCAVLVSPPAWRAGVALVGLACTVALAYATLALTWHYPSDVLAGFLVAGLWVALAIAVLRRVEAGPPEPAPPPGFWWLVGLGAARSARGRRGGAARARSASPCIPPNAPTPVVGSLALAALAVVIVAGTVILASTPGDGARRDRRPGTRAGLPPRDGHAPLAERLADRAAFEREPRPRPRGRPGSRRRRG